MHPDANLAALLWERAASDADANFLIDDRVGISWTFGEAAKAASQLSGKLAPGTTGVMLPNGAPVIVAMFAALARGNTVALLNPALSGLERGNALVDAGVTQLITDRVMIDSLGAPPDLEVLTVESVELLQKPAGSASLLPPVSVVAGEDDAVLIFTSGTTGRAKPAVLTHQRLRDAAMSMALSLKGKPGPYAVAPASIPPNLVAGPIAQTGGLNAIIFALVVGRRLLIMDRFKPARVAELAAAYALDTFVGTPTMLQMLATYDGEFPWPTLRKVISGGAPLTAAVQERFERRFGVPVAQVYGQTETGYIAGYSKEDLAEGRRRVGSVGMAYDGVEIVILDQHGQQVPVGSSGEVVVRTPFSMRGYRGSDSAAGEGDGWVHTGDLGFLDGDGYLYLVGRAKELILCGGFNVYPAEIEQALLSHDSVIEAAAFGIPDERLGEMPVAVVEGSADVDVNVLMEHVRERLAHYKAPREIRLVHELPRTESNKILKRKVRDEWISASIEAVPGA